MGEPLKVLDLFSGIGGFSLGLERAGMETVAFCEIDEKCQAVLQQRWPTVPIFADVRALGGIDFGTIDVICGGFPCQPFSRASAGKRKGQEDHRYLWPSMLDVVEKQKPSWVIGENVAGIDGLALGQVVSDMEGTGYEVKILEIPSCSVGRDHRRDRYWFCGYSDQNGKSVMPKYAKVAELQKVCCHPSRVGKVNGIPGRLDRLRMLGNAVDPQIPEMIGRAIMEIEDTRKSHKAA